jgi:predicted RecA/RadA family phage recombinase
MSEATLYKDADTLDVVTPSAGYSAGEVIQLPDGRAAVVQGLTARVENDPAALKTSGQHTLAKTASVVILDGDPIYWDRSANTATPLRAVAGADFPIGVAVGDAASADATVVVDLNVKPVYVVDLLRDPTDSVTVLTAATNVVNIVSPGCLRMALGTTHAEANKVDHLSQRSVPVTIPFIVEGRIAVYDIGDEASVDINVGIANGTHASDADTITESCFLHLDGTALDILAESDDGTTEVAATDTTVNAVDDTWFDFRMDCRNLTDIQLYINGVNVLSASVFKLNAATGPMKLLAHVEKGANDTPGEIRIAHLAIRAMDVVR